MNMAYLLLQNILLPEFRDQIWAGTGNIAKNFIIYLVQSSYSGLSGNTPRSLKSLLCYIRHFSTILTAITLILTVDLEFDRRSYNLSTKN